MSNARSPREVCSTTIGTSGLTVLASFRFGRLSPAAQLPGLGARRQPSNRIGPAFPAERLGTRGPELACRAALGAFGVTGRPELVAGLRLLDRDRLRGLRDQVERLALREVLLERLQTARGLQPL